MTPRRHPPGEIVSVEEGRRLLLGAQSERDFQAHVIDMAHKLGWWVAWFRPVRVQREGGSVYYETPIGADGKGWLDLYMTRGERAVVAELKVGQNKVTPEQQEWIAAHRATGVEVYVWTPQDQHEINEVLA